MKTTLKTLSVLLLAGTFTLTSCTKKTDPEPEEPTTTGGTTGGASSAPITPQIGDADGVLIASKIVISQTLPVVGTFTTVMGSGTASLYSATGSSANMVDGGTIKVNDSTLAKQSNNAYIFQPKSTGITYGSNSKWNVGGNSGNGVPALTYTANGFPSTPVITGTVTSISKGSNFTLTTNSISSADSVCFQITSSNTSVFKIKGGNQTSHTFTAAELSALDNTSYAYITITGYKFNNTVSSGKKYYFINLTTANKSVSITN